MTYIVEITRSPPRYTGKDRFQKIQKYASYINALEKYVKTELEQSEGDFLTLYYKIAALKTGVPLKIVERALASLNISTSSSNAVAIKRNKFKV